MLSVIFFRNIRHAINTYVTTKRPSLPLTLMINFTFLKFDMAKPFETVHTVSNMFSWLTIQVYI